MERVKTDLAKKSVVHGFISENKHIISNSVSDEGEKNIINYKDNSVGIAPEVVEKMFDPFFTTNKSMETGLGLSAVHNIITQKLLGEISYIQEPIGSHFRISFPKK